MGRIRDQAATYAWVSRLIKLRIISKYVTVIIYQNCPKIQPILVFLTASWSRGPNYYYFLEGVFPHLPFSGVKLPRKYSRSLPCVIWSFAFSTVYRVTILISNLIPKWFLLIKQRKKKTILHKELYRNGGKDFFTFSAVNLGWMAKSKLGETLSIEQLASNNPADLVGYTK